MEVGVDGTDEDVRDAGYCSLNLYGAKSGEDVVEVGVLTEADEAPKGTVT